MLPRIFQETRVERVVQHVYTENSRAPLWEELHRVLTDKCAHREGAAVVADLQCSQLAGRPGNAMPLQYLQICRRTYAVVIRLGQREHEELTARKYLRSHAARAEGLAVECVATLDARLSMSRLTGRRRSGGCERQAHDMPIVILSSSQSNLEKVSLNAPSTAQRLHKSSSVYTKA